MSRQPPSLPGLLFPHRHRSRGCCRLFLPLGKRGVFSYFLGCDPGGVVTVTYRKVTVVTVLTVKLLLPVTTRVDSSRAAVFSCLVVRLHVSCCWCLSGCGSPVGLRKGSHSWKGFVSESPSPSGTVGRYVCRLHEPPLGVLNACRSSRLCAATLSRLSDIIRNFSENT